MQNTKLFVSDFQGKQNANPRTLRLCASSKSAIVPISASYIWRIQVFSRLDDQPKFGEVWEQNRVLAGFGIGGKIGKGFIHVGLTKKYEELSATEKIQADCDLKATNIILQGLPSNVYSLVNHHRFAKDLWERIQLLMQGTSLTKQERECKLYDVFDKFAHINGELLHQYYLRFTQLINDMNIYKMKLEQFQVNTKFLNSLPPKWSKFVTDVNL
ncbi:hypothetical protein Tco_0393971 [Tanacetum coccineum]